MKINPYIFRGYDIRGIVDKDLNSEVVECIAKAYGTFLNQLGIKKAVVGYDCRKTSKQYSQDVIRGLNWAGIDVTYIGMELIGTFYWSQYYLDCKGGVYVSASHNPSEYNGFKMAVGFSETMVAEDIQKLRAMIEIDAYKKGAEQGKVKEQSVRQAYIDDLVKRFDFKKKFKVVVDPSCSTAGAIAPGLFRKAGFEVIEKNCKIDSSFPLGTPDPISPTVTERLAREILEEKADIGFSYDADGDRMGAADEEGNIIWNDAMVALFAISVLKKHPGATIMYNTLCSKMVEDVILKAGGKPFMWRTGNSFLKRKNQEVKAAFVGEFSGHFFFSKDFYNHDDGIYASLYLLDYLSRTNQSLSAAVKSFPKYISSQEIRVSCPDDKKVALIKKMVPVLEKDFPEAEIIDDERAGDGVRANLKNGMFVVRYSQNAPYLTIKFEAKTRKEYDSLKKYMDRFLHGYKEIDWNSSINSNLEALS